MEGLHDTQKEMSRHPVSAPFAAYLRVTVAAALVLAAAGCQGPQASAGWRSTLHDELPRYPESSPPRRSYFFTDIQTPTKRHQFDTFMAKGVYNGAAKD